MEEIKDEDINWAEEPVIGLALMLHDKEMVDSNANPIKGNQLYTLGKHLPTGMLVIIPLLIPPSVVELINEQAKLN